MIERTFETEKRSQALDVTEDINDILSEMEIVDSGVHIWVPHTTAGITVNESADPNVMDDLVNKLEELIPWNDNYDHIEQNAAAHIKSILLGSEQWLPVHNGSLELGRWQGVFLLEWDGPRERSVQVYPS